MGSPGRRWRLGGRGGERGNDVIVIDDDDDCATGATSASTGKSCITEARDLSDEPMRALDLSRGDGVVGSHKEFAALASGTAVAQGALHSSPTLRKEIAWALCNALRYAAGGGSGADELRLAWDQVETHLLLAAVDARLANANLKAAFDAKVCWPPLVSGAYEMA